MRLNDLRRQMCFCRVWGQMDKVQSGSSLVSNDAVSLLSGLTLMACPLRALQRPRSYQQSVTSHLRCTDRITLWQAACLPRHIALTACINPRRAHGNLGQSLLSESSRSSRIFFCYGKYTHTAEKKNNESCLFFCLCFLQYNRSLFPHTSGLCSVFDGSQYGQNKLELLIIACPDPLFQTV